jgi:hypothetical protein
MRLRLAFVAALAIAGFAFGASPALADAYHPVFDPQTTNVPYLAWRGEEVRLVKCEPNLGEVPDPWDDGSDEFDADWIVEDWSGDSLIPSLEQSTVKFSVEENPNGMFFGRHCVKANFVSTRPGLAMIKLVISDQATGRPLVKHQFLVGWLSLNKIRLDDGNGGTSVYDSPGWGTYNWLRARVTGTLPLTGFGDLYCPAAPAPPTQGCMPGLPAAIQLPAENKNAPTAGIGDPTTWWDDIARRLADTSSDVPLYRDNPWLMWDIHDDMSDASGHVDGDAATSPASPYSGPCDSTGVGGLVVKDTAIDAVDNCVGGLGEEGPFSRIWPTLTTGLAVGPFDPLRANETFLGDGKLDAGDVPMPSARVDFAITPNTGAPTDISGSGTLEPLDKEDVYIRDPEAGHDASHNMYAPFYRAYIPATRAEIPGHAGISSGTDASDRANNYPTYLTCDPTAYGDLGGMPHMGDDCAYPYWEKELTLADVVGRPTACLRRYNNGTPEYRATPSGDQAIVTYSDEHGEAMVKYIPGWDFYYDALIAAKPDILNRNNGCDIEDVSPLGTAQIKAIGRYPGQRVLDVDKVSNPIDESIYNNFQKSVNCEPKGATGNDRLAYICTAEAIDIDGTALDNEKVCFMSQQAEGIKSYPVGTPYTLDGLGRLCVQTDWVGRAQVEIFAKCSSKTSNVIADFVDEGLIRFKIVDFSYCPVTTTTTTTTTTTPTTTTTTTTPTTTTTTTYTTTVTSPTTTTKPATQTTTTPAQTTTTPPAQTTTTPPTTTTTTPTTVKAKVMLVRIQVVSFKKRSRYVNVRINASASTAKIDVRLIKVNGKTLRHVLRVIPTNRVVRVPNLKLDTIVKTVKVTIAA